MFHQLQKQMMQQCLKHHKLHDTQPSISTLLPPVKCKASQRLLTLHVVHTRQTLDPWKTTTLLPSYDHNKICSDTYRNVAQTPIEVSGARRMTRQHSHLGPVLLQRPQLAFSSQEN